MKRVVLLAGLILASVATAWAQTYHSDFGFSLNIPSGWEIISKEETMQNPEMLDTAFGLAKEESLKNSDKDLLGQLKAMVITGNVEYYFNRENRSLISVIRESGKLVQVPSDVKKECDSLPGQLTKLVGKPTKVYECELRRMENFNALYTAADGFKEGTKSLQYQLQKSPNELLIFTATCQNQYCKTVENEFDQMMTSLKVK